MLSLSKKLPPALWKGELSFAFDSFAPSRSERLPALAGEPLISEGILFVRDAIVQRENQQLSFVPMSAKASTLSCCWQ